jgi:Ca2+-binding RTX toxin-like protein
MPRLARTPHLQAGALLLAAVALLAAHCAAAADAGAARAKPKKRPPAVRAKVAKKTLVITGNAGSNGITLRLERRARRTLEVDTGGSGRAEFRFARSRFENILVRGGDGNDVLRIDEVNGVFTNQEKTTLAGDAGNDQLAGGAGAETLNGGPGNDGVDTGAGNDSAALGAGDDVLRSDPDDGGDRVQGDAGSDQLVINGSLGDDALTVAPDGPRAVIARGGATAIDADDVEAAYFSVLGGSDSITVDDLGGTDIRRTPVDLGASLGTPGDGAADRVIVNGSADSGTVSVSRSDTNVVVSGLPSNVSAAHFEPSTDALTINGQAGVDDVEIRD